MTQIFFISGRGSLDFLVNLGWSLEIMDFTWDSDFNPNILRGGGDDTQDYVVPASRFSIPLNIFP
jgi:hypothetical protein